MDKNLAEGTPLPQRYGAIFTIVLAIVTLLDGVIVNIAHADVFSRPAGSFRHKKSVPAMARFLITGYDYFRYSPLRSASIRLSNGG